MSKEKNGQEADTPVDENIKNILQALPLAFAELHGKLEGKFYNLSRQYDAIDKKLDQLLLNDKTIEGLLKDINKNLINGKKQNFTCQN